MEETGTKAGTIGSIQMRNRMVKSLVWLLVFCATLLRAQMPAEPSSYAASPSGAYLQQLLATDDARLHAWAAHFVLVEKRTSFLPALEQLASKALKSKADYQTRRALLAELDAIDQLGGEIPTADIAALDHMLAWQAHLLAGKPWEEALPIWQKLFKPETGEIDYQAQRIAAEMLARHAAPGFAVQLLSSIQVHATIIVHDANLSGGIGYRSSCCGSGLRGDPLPWPSVAALYLFEPRKISDAPPPGSTVFVGEPNPIYLVRTEKQGNWPTAGCDTGIRPLNDRNRSRLTGVLLGGVGASPFPEEQVQIDILFSDREAYRARVAAFVDEQQRNFDAVGRTAEHAGLLTEMERQKLKLAIELYLIDSRISPGVDLPGIAFGEQAVWTQRPPLPF